MVDPRLTVVIPIYNRSGEVDRLIENLLAQDMGDAEFLLIDDGSTDDTNERIKALLPMDTRLRLISKSNTGTGETRNLGIHESKGKWLFFLDSDDAIPSTTILSKLIRLAEDNGVQIAGGSIQFQKRGREVAAAKGWTKDNSTNIDTWLNKIGDLTVEPPEYFVEEGVYSYDDYQYDAGFSRFIYNRKFLINNDITFPRTTFYEDPLFFVRAMDAASRFAVTTEPTYIYRIGWHQMRYDEVFCRDNLQGMRSNLIFSKDRGYSQLHRITYERFKGFDVVELALNDNTYEELSELVKTAYEAFDPEFAGVEAGSELPPSVDAVNRYGTSEWNKCAENIKRFRRIEAYKVKNAVKRNPLLMRLWENSNGLPMRSRH